jgi:hypothetical protein
MIHNGNNAERGEDKSFLSNSTIETEIKSNQFVAVRANTTSAAR